MSLLSNGEKSIYFKQIFFLHIISLSMHLSLCGILTIYTKHYPVEISGENSANEYISSYQLIVQTSYCLSN